MTPTYGATLLCWHAERAGMVVLENALKALRNDKIDIAHVLYLVQGGKMPTVPDKIGDTTLELVVLDINDPTRHTEIYAQVEQRVLPRLRKLKGDLHLNISPGTPAMHSVWLILHAGGALPHGARLWSSQLSSETKRTRIDEVDFPVTTYLAQIRHIQREDPDLAIYEPRAHSPARRSALDNLARYARVVGAPLLILGERGTGKTRLVETFVKKLKARPKVVTVACGGLDSDLAESALFGHCRGAYTGAASERKGYLAEANGGILFLDEVQDLPPAVQRKLVRVFQDRLRRYRPVGSDEEKSTDVELVCASNLPMATLRERLDADLFDRLSHLVVSVPPLRDCRDDVHDDWSRVWRELRRSGDVAPDAPWSDGLARALQQSPLPGPLCQTTCRVSFVK
jgi:sigma54-dependent transcription regulator